MASDHVCKPVIIDSGGRKQPIVSHSPNPSTVITKTVVQEIHSPSPYVIHDYKHTSPTPHDLPQKVEECKLKLVGTNTIDPLSATHWRQTPNSTKQHGSNTTAYGDYNNLNNKEVKQSSSYDDYYYRKSETAIEPTIITDGGWARPNRSAWASPPDTSLSKPIGTTMKYLEESATTREYGDVIDSREAAKRYGTTNILSKPVETYSTTIDSREATRKYGGAAM